MSLKFRINSRILLVSIAPMLAMIAGNSQATEIGGAQVKDAVVATVNGVAINASRVDLLVRQRAAQGQQDSAEMRKAIIENLALQFMVSEEAVKKGLDKAPETVEQLDLARQSIFANAFVQDYIKNNPVSDDVVKAEYEKIKALDGGNEYKASHILVAKEVDAKAIIAKLKKNPKTFGALAKEKSMDPGSKEKGGDLGWFDPRGMVPEFGAAVTKLEKGKFSAEPIKSQFGYHVILLEDSRPKQIPPFEQVKEKLKQQVQQQNLKNLFADIKAKGRFEIVSSPEATSATSIPPAAAK